MVRECKSVGASFHGHLGRASSFAKATEDKDARPSRGDGMQLHVHGGGERSRRPTDNTMSHVPRPASRVPAMRAPRVPCPMSRVPAMRAPRVPGPMSRVPRPASRVPCPMSRIPAMRAPRVPCPASHVTRPMSRVPAVRASRVPCPASRVPAMRAPRVPCPMSRHARVPCPMSRVSPMRPGGEGGGARRPTRRWQVCAGRRQGHSRTRGSQA